VDMNNGLLKFWILILERLASISVLPKLISELLMFQPRLWYLFFSLRHKDITCASRIKYRFRRLRRHKILTVKVKCMHKSGNIWWNADGTQRVISLARFVYRDRARCKSITRYGIRIKDQRGGCCFLLIQFHVSRATNGDVTTNHLM
jgi:hypothetical protein